MGKANNLFNINTIRTNNNEMLSIRNELNEGVDKKKFEELMNELMGLFRSNDEILKALEKSIKEEKV